MSNENCLRCGLPQSHQRHNAKNPPPEGWHSFRGQAYLDGLEDALLFVREHKQQHQWVGSGIMVAVVDSFEQKHCKVCGAINWGGAEDGICFGNNHAEAGIIEAHNRRVVQSWK